MARFDPQLWKGIGQRLGEARGGKSVDDFLKEHPELDGLHWYAIEDGRQGCSVESLIKICRELDLNPTWLLFGDISGIQQRKLSDVNSGRSHKGGCLTRPGNGPFFFQLSNRPG
jgi:hypothetical protein